MKSLAQFASLLFLLLSFTAPMAQTTIGDHPSDGCEDERNESFANGFNTGYGQGVNDGYNSGFNDGWYGAAAQRLAECVADPASCGITLASCIPDPTFGETEPNDNFIAADPLVLGANFWGQSYGAADQDWFYTETRTANENLTINFSVPGGNLTGWKMSVRDAAGNVFAEFNTAVSGGVPTTTEDESATYRVTLGLVGTYYIVVQPTPPATCAVIDPGDPTCQQNFSPYYIAAFLQESGLDSSQPIVGFYDNEIEPNDIPSRATPMATGVSMYGLINLTFNVPLPSVDGEDTTYTWGQGEDDYYVYLSAGNEIVTLVFCAKEECGPGNWFIEVYDQVTAQRIEAGESREDLKPLLAFNTDTENEPRAVFRVGLRDPGYYFLRVNHKRLFTAPCLGYQFLSTTSETGFTGFCECESGNSCSVPADCTGDEGLFCENVPTDCIVGIEPGCFFIEDVPPGCGVPDPESGEVTLCDTYQTQARCSCSQYGGVVEVPENEYTSPYNFTWHGTQLPPNTIDTDAFEDFLNRASPYN